MTLQKMRRIRNTLAVISACCYFSGCAQLPDNHKLFKHSTNIPKMLVESIKSK